MPDARRRSLALAAGAAAVLLCLGASRQDPARPPSTLERTLASGFDAIDAGRIDDARAIFQRALDEAVAAGNVRGEAEASRGAGRVKSIERDFAAAGDWFARARTLFERAGDDQGLGRVWNHLGSNAWEQGQWAEARACYERARAAFAKAGLAGDEANILRNLTLLPDGTVDEKLALIATAVDRARIGRAPAIEALALHTWGDLLYIRSEYAASTAKLEAALAILEPAGRVRDLARLYTSLGRIYRIHGEPARALTYYEQALVQQRAVRDRSGEVQTLNAIGLALSVMGRSREAERRYEEALSLARAASLPQTGFILQQLGVFHVDMRRYARGAALLEEALTLERGAVNRARALSSLARAYLALGRVAAARTAADEAIVAAAASGDVDASRQAFMRRAEVRLAGADPAGALDDVREGLKLIERLRPNLLPADPLRLSFAERIRHQFDFAVTLMMQTGAVDEAFAVSEQGRARAFVDLLSSQVPVPEGAGVPPLDRLKEIAARLESHTVSYWVTPEATFVWVLAPDGGVRGRKLPISAARLERLVRATWASSTDVDTDPAWRALYDDIILPIRRWLPRADGPLLTIVPHGPLLRLSFAALRNERGRYLLEGYRLHYTPALSVLPFTARRKPETPSSRVLVVANSTPSAAIGAAERLPPLPGAAAEAGAIARVSAGSVVHTLTGDAARESTVRTEAGQWSTLHFAVHGIVRDDRALTSSFLVLTPGPGSGDPAADGTLTASEIYSLDLRADLVVLSACRSASGRITGDGIVGLTRAFMYAGAASVVASIWDVPDETAPRLFEAFYRSRAAGSDPSQALRDAQLEMLQRLRAGAIEVTTPAGRVTLPAHPAIWAGLQVWGEP